MNRYLVFFLLCCSSDSMANFGSEDILTINSNQPLEVINTNEVAPMPTADAGAAKRVCLNDSVQIGGAPTGPVGATYLWDNAASLTDETSPNPKAFPRVTTTYTVTVTDGVNGTATDQVTVTVDSLPFVFAGLDQTICEGTSTVIGDTASSMLLNVSYKWSNSASLNFDTLANPIASPTTTTTYTVTLTNQFGCKSVDQVKVAVRRTPKINTGPDRVSCNGAPVQVQLGGSPTGPFFSNYLWDNASSLNDAFISNPTATPTVTTTYAVTVTHTGVVNCTNTAQVTVFVDSFPVINAGIDTTICRGNSIALGGNPTFQISNATYRWSNPASLDNRNSSNPIATPLVNTTYTVTVTDGASSCTSTEQVNITVDATSPIADAGSDTSICIGESVSIGATSSGLAYIWDNSNSLSDTSISNPVATPDTTTTYNLLVTSTSSCTATDQITVTVDSFPIVNAGINDTICEGFSILLGDAASSSNQFSYLWDNATSLDFDTLATPTASPSVTTLYSVTVTNGLAACSASDQVTISVETVPIAEAGPDVTICEGVSVQLGNNPDPTPSNIVLAWSPALGLSDSTLANPIASPLVTTTYTVVSTDTTTFCSTTDQVTVFVDTLPIADAGLDKTICEKDSISIGVIGAGGVSYQWDNAASLTNASSANPTAFPSASTIYTLTASLSTGCSSTDQMQLTVNPLPVVKAGIDKTICRGDTVILGSNPTSTGTGLSYLWSNGVSLNNELESNPKAYPSDSTKYVVDVIDGFGCKSADSVLVNVNPNPSASFSATSFCEGTETSFTDNSSIVEGSLLLWRWEFGDGVGFSNSQNPKYTYLADGSYEVKLIATSQVGCKDSTTQTVVINPKPEADAGVDQEICIGDDVQIGGDPTTGLVYLWSSGNSLSNPSIANPIANPSVSREYRLSVTNQFSCQDFDTVQVVVNNLPVVTATGDQIACVDQLVQLNATGADTYQWLPSIWLDNPSSPNPTSVPKKSITYIVSGTDSKGCVNNDTVKLDVFNVDFYSTDTTICNGTEIQLNPIIEGDISNVGYQWESNTSLSSTSVKNPIASPTTDQLYILNVTNSAGCEDTDSFKVNLNGLLGLGVELETELECAAANVKALNKSTNADQFKWFLNGTLISEDKNTSFKIDNNVENKLVLVGFSNGCTDTLFETIAPINYSELLKQEKPNVFTPNGDGVNDTFDPIYLIKDKPIGCIDFEFFRIYNRWGRLIFETIAEDEPWLGQNRDESDVEAGLYYYVIRVSGVDVKGSVYLNR